MTTLITLFVAAQLILGFAALVSAVFHAETGYEDEAGFHSTSGRFADQRRTRLRPSVGRTPSLILSAQSR